MSPAAPTAAIVGLAATAPDARCTNADLAARLDTDDAWIVSRTGIRERRVAAPEETTATLAAAAVRGAVADAGLAPGDIDLLIVATATPEQPIPHTGAFVGHLAGLGCGSFDVAAGCAGFVTALVTGAALVTSRHRHVVVAGAETLTRIVDPHDRATAVLFGDGAGAVVLGPDPAGFGVLAHDLGCDGSATDLLAIPAGGSRRPTTAATVAAGEHVLRMTGREVFRRAVAVVVESAGATLGRAGVTAEAVDWFVPHQANRRIIDAAATRIGIPMERTVVNLDRYGNTSAASIPLALRDAVGDRRVRPGDLVLLAGFGAGMTWASALVRWGPGRTGAPR